MKNEDMDILMQGLHQRIQKTEAKSKQEAGEDILDRSKPYIYQQKGSVIFIRGIREEDMANFSYMKPIKVSNDG